jgi:hypothetical protein
MMYLQNNNKKEVLPMSWGNGVPFDTLQGKTLTSIEVNKEDNDDRIIFTTDEGEVFSMHHDQDCCEWVYIEDICGELDDLIGSPIVLAQETSNSDDPMPLQEYSDEYYTWTFYNLATAKGHVTLRWYGSSNGYYSESVDLHKIE